MEKQFELVVAENFQGYNKGDIITDPEKVTEILDSEWQAHVIKRSPTEKAAS